MSARKLSFERSCTRPRDLDMAEAIRKQKQVQRSSYYNPGRPVTAAHLQQQRTIERSAPGSRQMPAALRTPEYRELKPGYYNTPSDMPIDAAMRANEQLIRATGGFIIQCREETSAVVAAIAENEKLTQAALEKEKSRNRQYKQAQSLAASRNTVPESISKESQRQQEVHKMGSAVMPALYDLEVSYGYK